MSDREMGAIDVAIEYSEGQIASGLHTAKGFNCSLTTLSRSANSTYVEKMASFIMTTTGAKLSTLEMSDGFHKINFTVTDIEALHSLKNTIEKNSPNVSVSGLAERYEGVSHTAKPSAELKYHYKSAEVEKGNDITYTLTR